MNNITTAMKTTEQRLSEVYCKPTEDDFFRLLPYTDVWTKFSDLVEHLVQNRRVVKAKFGELRLRP